MYIFNLFLSLIMAILGFFTGSPATTPVITQEPTPAAVEPAPANLEPAPEVTEIPEATPEPEEKVRPNAPGYPYPWREEGEGYKVPNPAHGKFHPEIDPNAWANHKSDNQFYGTFDWEDVDTFSQKVFDEWNNRRIAAGLQPVQFNNWLKDSSRFVSEDLAWNNKWRHSWVMLPVAGAEALHQSRITVPWKITPEWVIDHLFNSPEHHKVMMDPESTQGAVTCTPNPWGDRLFCAVHTNYHRVTDFNQMKMDFGSYYLENNDIYKDAVF